MATTKRPSLLNALMEELGDEGPGRSDEETLKGVDLSTIAFFSRGNSLVPCHACRKRHWTFASLGQHECRFHPGLPVRGTAVGVPLYSCCNRPCDDEEDLGCVACDHSEVPMVFDETSCIDGKECRKHLSPGLSSVIPSKSFVNVVRREADDKGRPHVVERRLCISRYNKNWAKSRVASLPYTKKKRPS